VLVTHEADIAQFASRVLVFRDGRLTKDEAVAMPKEARRFLAALPPEEDDA
jgi:ABC-type lipoprotein export system ATPase subunit